MKSFIWHSSFRLVVLYKEVARSFFIAPIRIEGAICRPGSPSMSPLLGDWGEAQNREPHSFRPPKGAVFILMVILFCTAPPKSSKTPFSKAFKNTGEKHGASTACDFGGEIAKVPPASRNGKKMGWEQSLDLLSPAPL